MAGLGNVKLGKSAGEKMADELISHPWDTPMKQVNEAAEDADKKAKAKLAADAKAGKAKAEKAAGKKIPSLQNTKRILG